ncbi:polysaccharide biosynthesis C-terminal domain-containing protein [Rhodopirellula sallentina]|uniref:Capsular polysaccharide synthesis enzyme CapF n=1 Tax=Rhodopirellula sallentina SM41 TaxID=1263870 RepID=M5UF87_9BACT|nr:NAD-dependent epimerase/dehydratase family protein [Rhodopirellula sallentina]EMI56511.1 capsular polysaccharide synthesis enzyme CapF [Rhodopirellula sallentina SM41]
MKNICITGSAGLLGRHALVHLKTQPDVKVRPIDHTTFDDTAKLQEALADADVVYHFAGQNRGEPEKVAAANVAIADRLASALSASVSSAHVIYSNSIHSTGDTPYGRSKKAVADRLADWAGKSDGQLTDVLLPHVFGEHGKPFYNSVVSTFCHQVASGETPTIASDGDLELLHAGQVAELFWNAIETGSGTVRPKGVPMKVSELLARLQHLAGRYADGVVPNVEDPMDLRLFNTYRSYIPMDQRPIDLTVHSDDRGGLFESIRSDGPGQVFLSTTKPGITRGNHFHLRKVERFLVVQGTAKIRVRHVLSGDTHAFDVSGNRPQAIDIPTLYTHNISNVGDDELLTLFWAHEHFDPENSDTFFLEV